MSTVKYPIAVNVSLQNYYTELHRATAFEVAADLRTAIVARFLQLDPSLDRAYVQGHVMAAWYTLTMENRRPTHMQVVIRQPNDPFPELSREFLVGLVAQVFANKGASK